MFARPAAIAAMPLADGLASHTVHGCAAPQTVCSMGSTATRFTLCHGRVGNGQDRKGRFGNQCDGEAEGVTLFGIGRERLESPSVGSSPGHPMKLGLVLQRLRRTSSVSTPNFRPTCFSQAYVTLDGLRRQFRGHGRVRLGLGRSRRDGSDDPCSSKAAAQGRTLLLKKQVRPNGCPLRTGGDPCARYI